MQLFSDIKKYKSAYKNYIAASIDVSRKKNRIILSLKNGKRAIWNYEKTYLYTLSTFYPDSSKNIEFYTFEDTKLPHCINFKFKTGPLMMCGLDNDNDFADVFIFDRLSFLTTKDKDILCISEDNGESFMYFSINDYSKSNKNKIIGINPRKEIVGKNLKVNDIEKRIKLLDYEYKDGSDIKLKTIMNENNIDSGYLFIDSKSSENKILEEENETLKKFSKIEIKVYNNNYLLKVKLENAGFKVDTVKNPHNDILYLNAEI